VIRGARVCITPAPGCCMMAMRKLVRARNSRANRITAIGVARLLNRCVSGSMLTLVAFPLSQPRPQPAAKAAASPRVQPMVGGGEW